MANIYVRKFIDFPKMFLVDFLHDRLNKKGRVCDAAFERPFRYVGHQYLLIVRDKKNEVILLVPADDPYKIILLDLSILDEVLRVLKKFECGADILIEALY